MKIGTHPGLAYIPNQITPQPSMLRPASAAACSSPPPWGGKWPGPKPQQHVTCPVPSLKEGEKT